MRVGVRGATAEGAADSLCREQVLACAMAWKPSEVEKDSTASGVSRSTLRYRPTERDDSGFITFIQTHMALARVTALDCCTTAPASKASPGARRCYGACTASYG